jgi:ribonuclease HI
MTEFISSITPEKKKKRELKYTLYTDGSCDNNKVGGWASIIIDKNEKQFTISGKEENTTNNRMEMVAIIEGLNWIYTSVDQKYRKYITITLFSDSVYCVNTIKDWIYRWEKDESIETRPNADLLKQLLDILNKVKVEARWIQRVSNPYAWSVDKIANDRRIEN